MTLSPQGFRFLMPEDWICLTLGQWLRHKAERKSSLPTDNIWPYERI